MEGVHGLITERFDIHRHLGSGGFGDVYEAFDRPRGEIVALKVLKRADAAALYRFKHEFRTLANLAHRNLVTLYELFSESDQWFLTMELIRGVNFVDYVRVRPTTAPGPPSPASTRDSASNAVTLLSAENDLSTDSPLEPLPIETLHIDRVRAALADLAAGVHVLHQHGILHLDIKPSNVLVDETGRVVLVDFGLAERLSLDTHRAGERLQIVGTPEFMSPEQAASEPPSEASDWYCVGALLYRALTGVPAFRGKVQQVLQDKLNRAPKPPAEWVRALPADLDRLCRELLHREPRDRPTGTEILNRLGASVESAPGESLHGVKPERSIFVGRASHLAALRAAYDDMRGGKAAAVYIHGESGMGKTALARRFLDGLRAADPNVIVLEGRCYEHEVMAFKAFDSIVDALSDYLRRLADAEVAPLLPRGIGALARIFPVLQRVDAIASARERSRDVGDVAELRRRAFTALREFFARIAERHPLVLFIDDLQWGDVDSAALLGELLRPPDPPPLLLVASYRSAEVETSACLRALFSAEHADASAIPARQVSVGELQPNEAEELALALLPTNVSQARADAIAREARGNPLFIDHLSRQAGHSDGGEQTLDTVLWNRTRLLPPSSQRLMEVIAVAGRPVPFAIAAEAATLESGKYDLLASLRAAKFIRSREFGESIAVEPYHDRIRETIVARLEADTLREHHRRLALALESSSRPDPEALVVHFRAAGDAVRAARYAVAAADKSADALAFDGAARLYALALELQPQTPHRRALQIKLGDALAMGGRVVESARAYIEAMDDAGPEERIELRRRAGEQYLLGGHLEEGLAHLQALLADVGMNLPATPRRALIAFLLRQFYLRLRGLGYRQRSENEIPPRELQRLDMCHLVCRGLGFTDSIRAIELQTRHLLLALKAGEPYRLARALTFSATADGIRARTRPRAERLLQKAKELAERVQNTHATGLVHSTTGLVHLAAGRFSRAVPEFEMAAAILRERSTTVPYEINLCYVYKLESLYLAGQLKEYFRLIPEYLAICQGRGDLFSEGNLRMRNAHRRCFVDADVVGAREELRKAELSWRGQKLQLAQANLLFREIELAHYSGDAQLAWDVMIARWQVLAPLRLFGFQGMTTQAYERRAYCALGMAAAAVEKNEPAEQYLKAAEDAAHQLDRWKSIWGPSVAELVRAGVALHRGQSDVALKSLESAEAGFREVGMALHLTVTRWRKGMILGGDRGRALIEESRAWMVSQGVRDPERLSRIIAPATWRRL